MPGGDGHRVTGHHPAEVPQELRRAPAGQQLVGIDAEDPGVGGFEPLGGVTGGQGHVGGGQRPRRRARRAAGRSGSGRWRGRAPRPRPPEAVLSQGRCCTFQRSSSSRHCELPRPVRFRTGRISTIPARGAETVLAGISLRGLLAPRSCGRRPRMSTCRMADLEQQGPDPDRLRPVPRRRPGGVRQSASFVADPAAPAGEMHFQPRRSSRPSSASPPPSRTSAPAIDIMVAEGNSVTVSGPPPASATGRSWASRRRATCCGGRASPSAIDGDGRIAGCRQEIDGLGLFGQLGLLPRLRAAEGARGQSAAL